MLNMRCTGIQTSLSGFPEVTLSNKAIQVAHEQGMQADFFYCYRLLTETGIITAPGSAIGKVLKDNKIHFHLNNLLSPISKMQEVLNKIEKFN